MGVEFFPTSQEVADYLSAFELPARTRLFSDLPVDKILRYGAIVGARIKTYDSLPRCMALARTQIAKAEKQGLSYNSGSVIAARSLASGKGRFDRSWYGPEGGLWLNLALVNTWLPKTSQLLPLMAGIALAETCRSFNIPAGLKWVNDLVLGDLKIAGVLTEGLVGRESGEEYILIGIGLNVNNSCFPPELIETSTSLQLANDGKEMNLKQVALVLLAKLVWNLGLLTYEEEELGGDHSLFMANYRTHCQSVGRQVVYGYDAVAAPQYEAVVTGINADGSISLKLSSGDEVIEHGGEIFYNLPRH